MARQCGTWRRRRTARDTYIQALDRIKAVGADSNVSLKLTQMGLDVGEQECVEHVRTIVSHAGGAEGRSYASTWKGRPTPSARSQLFAQRFHPEFGDTVGVVLQSYLRRTERDVTDMIALGARVRLCKGAYQESADIAFPDKKDVDANYITCMEQLLERGNYPAIATHDERIIARAKAFVTSRRIPTTRFEFQMLFGVRRDLQRALRREGYRLRVYVPFGDQWYPYLMRRLAERPANIAFLLSSLVKESLRR